MKVKTNIVRWGDGGVVHRKGGKTTCYTLSKQNLANGKFSIKTQPMDVMRLFSGPDCYPWMKSFAYWPVKTIRGKYVWLRPIYKQRFWAVWGDGFHMEPEVEYAELLDILTELT